MKLQQVDINSYIKVKNKNEYIKLLEEARKLGYLHFSVYENGGSMIYSMGARYFNLETGDYQIYKISGTKTIQFKDLDFDDLFVEVWYM